MDEVIYPCKTCVFRVLIDQQEEAGFSEVSAPGLTPDPVEFREDPLAGKVPGKQSGIVTYSCVTLKRGTTQSHAFVDWMKSAQNNPILRKTVFISLMDDEMKEAAVWQLEKAWPAKYTAIDFTATCNEAAIESLELVCEDIARIK